MRDFVFIVSYGGGQQSSVMLVQATGERRARELALRVLGENPRRRAIEVWEDARHLFTVGDATPEESPCEAGA